MAKKPKINKARINKTTIKKVKIKKAERESKDLRAELIQKLKPILPEAVVEEKVNWERLKQALGEHIDVTGEKFTFTWAGKSSAIRNVLIPSKATLKPAIKESVKFEETENIFIEGDNLEVLKLLQKSYFERVKMVYIDPPFNTGNDFVYKDNFKNPLKNYLEQSGQVDSEGNRLSTNTQASGRFHSDWLSMMYPRLYLGRNLLREDGVIFISIDDHEVDNLRKLCNEIFGEENFVAQFVWTQGRKSMAAQVAINHEYCLVYCRNRFAAIEADKKVENTNWTERKDGLVEIYEAFSEAKAKWKEAYDRIEEEMTKFYDSLDDEHPSAAHRHYKNVDAKGLYFAGDISQGTGMGGRFDILHPITNKPCKVPTGGWRFSPDKLPELLSEGRIHFGSDEKSVPCLKRYLHETEYEVAPSVFYRDGRGASKRLDMLFGAHVFEHPKDEQIIARFIRYVTSVPNSDALVLDFFAGSGTTAHAVLDLNSQDGGNRKFLLVQMAEPTEPKSEAYKAGYKTIADICKERIRRVIKGYGDDPKPINDGFKVFKLDKSNYQENLFEYDPEKTEVENEKAFKKYLKKSTELFSYERVNELDFVYENVIKEGLDLNAKITTITIGKNKAYKATDNQREILISLDKKIGKETVDELKDKKYKEKVFVCFDSALDDSSKANLALNVSLKTI